MSSFLRAASLRERSCVRDDDAQGQRLDTDSFGVHLVSRNQPDVRWCACRHTAPRRLTRAQLARVGEGPRAASHGHDAADWF